MHQRSAKELADQAALYVSTRLHTHPTLAEVAQAVSTNTRVLKEAFRQHYGTTLASYGRTLRVTRAKELLTTTPMQIIEIAFAVGYCDGPGLTEAFVKVNGISPGRYRKLYKVVIHPK